MKFQTKIFLVTLIILVSTLALNSVLSIASFEKIYVASLISIYEVSGKNLKRKIETSLRLGKPMDKFEGMERLLSEVMVKNSEITDVGVGNIDGEILYHSDPQKIGTRFNPPLPSFTSPDQVHSRLILNQYVTFLPLADRSNAITGAIRFSFPRAVVYDRLKAMAYENLTILWNIMLTFSIGLIVFIALLVARPIRKDLIGIGRRLEWPPIFPLTASDKQTRLQMPVSNFSGPNQGLEKHAATDLPQVLNPEYLNIGEIRNELDRLDFYLSDFVFKAVQMLEKVEGRRREKQALIAAILGCSDVYERLKNSIDLSSEDPGVKEMRASALLKDTEKILDMLSFTGQSQMGSAEALSEPQEAELTQ
ncbi:MAG: hypothetical protein V1844_13590 [Pseudomonadota bacterium]